MNLTIQKEDVKRHFDARWPDFYGHFVELKNGKGDQYTGLCPFHDDHKPSLSVDGREGLFKCFACGASGDAFTFYRLLKGVSGFPEILQGIAEEFNILPSGSPKSSTGKSPSSKKSKIVTAYDYTDEKGDLLFQVVRYEPKDFKQRRPDGKGGWLRNLQGVRRVLYRLPEVLKALLVLILEGEKDVDNIRGNFKMAATTCPGGAGKWREEYNKALAGKDAVLIPDNDDAGHDHVEKIAKSLKGVAKSIRILELPGLPDKGDVSDWIEAGGTKKELNRLIEECPLWEPEEDPGAAAKKLFPRGPFPWGVLPAGIADSLKQLARSCATSATSLPGAAIAIFASMVGSIVSVSPKLSWMEPLIFWLSDIRDSGAGKTPAARALCEVLYDAQTKADEAYKEKLEEWLAIPKKNRGQAPQRPRGYFVTDLTLEGLREDHSGHGGKVCIMDEVSAFLSSQNQYKGGKGSDRESWINLHDGKPARIVRVGKTIWLRGARISIFGGIQPAIWIVCFSGEDGGVYLVDGTVFRFLPVYEGSAFYPLTAEAWSDDSRKEWESLLRTVMRWSDSLQAAKEKKGLCLGQAAQELFLNWRNELYMLSWDLPPIVRGFIPKLVGYALRFAGVLYLMDVFSRGQEPGSVLDEEDIQKGIAVSEFYLGHIIAAMELLTDEDAPVLFEVTEQMIHLAKTLDAISSDIDSGKLGIGYIWKRFNEKCRKEQKVKSAKAMGAILRRCGLTIAKGKHNVNGKESIKCLQWDEKTNSLIERSLQSLQSLQNEENQTVIDGDILCAKSAKSPTKEDGNGGMETSETNQNRSLRAEHAEMIDNGDNGDNGSDINKNTELDWSY